MRLFIIRLRSLPDLVKVWGYEIEVQIYRLFCIFAGVSTASPQIANFMGPTWGPPGSCRPQMVPMLTSWTLLSGYCPCACPISEPYENVITKPRGFEASCDLVIIHGDFRGVFLWLLIDQLFVTSSGLPADARRAGDKNEEICDFLKFEMRLGTCVAETRKCACQLFIAIRKRQHSIL